MDPEKNFFIDSLQLELSELLAILLKNQDTTSIYAVSIIKNMLNMLDEFKDDDLCDTSDFANTIRKQYKSMFPPKMGLSEFYIWDDDFQIRVKKNKEYKDILENIENILSEN